MFGMCEGKLVEYAGWLDEHLARAENYRPSTTRLVCESRQW